MGLTFAVAGLAATPTCAVWLEARSPHFIVFSQDSEAGIRKFTTRLERFDAGIRYLHRRPDRAESRSNPLTVYVVANTDAIERLCSAGEKRPNCRNVAGFYVPRAAGSLAFTPRSTRAESVFDLNAQTVLFHEYTHHFMMENYAAAYPSWFIEGFAEFNSTATIAADGSIGFGLPAMHRYAGLALGTPLPLETLLRGDGRPLNRDERESLYGQGWLLTHYLTFAAARSGELEAYLSAINAGTPGLDAAKAAFGDLKKLDNELGVYKNRSSLKYFKIPPTAVPPVVVTVRALTAGESATIAARMRVEHGGFNAAEATAIAAEARGLAAAFPGDAGAQAVLAEAELAASNHAAADAAADRALAADPACRRAMIVKGQVAGRRAFGAAPVDRAAWKTARSWFVGANKLDPDFALPLMLYYQSFMGEGVRPTPVAVAGLNRAFELAPQDRGLRFMLARQYLIDGKRSEARLLLAPLAFDPHAAGDNPVRLLIAQIDAGDIAGATATMGKGPPPDE